MKVARETCVAGKVIDITIRVPSGKHTNPRAPRKCITAEKVQKNNDRIAAKTLTRIINANFNSSGWHDILTYKEEPSARDAKRELDNFIGRMRRATKKLGIEFKWIVATEYIGERLHHHFITNAPLKLVRSKWGNGHVLPRPLDEGPNYYKLADYIIKETSKSFRDIAIPFGTRYSHSRNLYIPKPLIEYVEEKQLFEDPKPRKGYYIDQDTVRKFEHPITGLEHLEYMMVSLEEEPRIKKYYKGKRKSREENYWKYINYIEEQQSLLV